MIKLITIILFFVFSLPLLGQGPQWVIYKTSNSNIPTNNIFSIAFEGDTVWLGSDSGAIKMINGNWSHYSVFNSDIPNNIVYKIAIDDNARKLMGTIDGGAAVFDNGVWTAYDTSNSPLPYNIVFDVDFDTTDNMWMATPFGVAKTNGTVWEVFNSSTFPPLINVNRVKVDPFTNKKFIGTNYSGLSVYNDTNWVHYDSKNSGLSNDGIRDLEIDLDGNIWICTFDNGISKFNFTDSIWTTYMQGISTRCIAIDTMSNKWFGTPGDRTRLGCL